MAAKGSRPKTNVEPEPEPEPAADLHSQGGRVVSVFGPFGTRVLVEMPASVAAGLFPDSLGVSGPTDIIDAVERDLAAIRAADAELAESALAALAVSLAREIAHPGNSATSKSMCARTLLDTMNQLRDLAPAKEEGDGLDDLSARRAARLAGGSTA